MNRKRLVIAGSLSMALSGALGAQPPIAPGQLPYAVPDTAPPPAMIDPDGMTVAPQPLPLPPGPIPPRALRRRDLSWIYIDRPRPRKVGVHDIITVIVDEKSEVTQNSRFN